MLASPIMTEKVKSGQMTESDEKIKGKSKRWELQMRVAIEGVWVTRKMTNPGTSEMKRRESHLNYSF